MDFKGLLKNKFFIALIIVGVLACASALLSQVSVVFYVIACLLCTTLCVMVGVKNILNYNKEKNNNTAELLPLTEEERELIKRNKRNVGASFIVRAVMFFAFGILFFALIFNM